jgi:hypothetical protein
LKVGIAADIRARCPAVERRVLSVALGAYARRVMYLQSLVEGAARVDLDGNPAGEVTAKDAEYAAAKLAGILASREARRAGAGTTAKVAKAKVAKPATTATVATATPPAVKTLRGKPVLRYQHSVKSADAASRPLFLARRQALFAHWASPQLTKQAQLFLLEFFLCYDPAVPEGSEFFHLVSCRSVARVSALGARYFGSYYGLQPCELLGLPAGSEHHRIFVCTG